MEPDEPNSTLKLPLFSMALTTRSPEHSGMLTPPLYTSASVPFRWEEEPGKPRPCTALIPFPATDTTAIESPKCLELPPRLFLEPIKANQSPSPTTVLDGPYVMGRPKFTSFRFSRERQGSFDSIDSKSSPERGQLSSNVVLGKKLHKGSRGGIFGSSRYNIRTPKVTRPGKIREVGGSSSFVHPSSVISLDSADFGSDESSIPRTKVSRMRRNGSFSSLSRVRSHFWAAVYEGIKQAIPWKSRKSKKGLV